MTTPTKCPTCGSAEPEVRNWKGPIPPGGRTIYDDPCDNSDFHGESGEETGRQVTTPIGEPMPTTYGPLPAPPDSRGGVEEARREFFRLTGERLAKQHDVEYLWVEWMAALDKMVTTERADAAQQARDAGNAFAAGEMSSGKLAEVLGVDDKAAFKARAHASCDVDEAVRQARAEVAEMVHVAGCDCHEFRPHRNLLDRPCQREGCGEYHHGKPHLSHLCLAERKRVKVGK